MPPLAGAVGSMSMVDDPEGAPLPTTGGLVLSAAEKRVLAALSRRPLGLYPHSSVALAAGLDREDATRALEGLAAMGLVTGEAEPVPSRPVRQEVVWRLDVAEAWRRVPDVLRHTRLPVVGPAPLPARLPERFAHLFWWGEPSSYELPRDAVAVAEQMLACDDVTAWGWALFTLPPQALESVAERPHLPEDRRELIRNAVANRRGAAV